ncbi:MAG: hypothetical protein JW395_2988 [Nitrospira sp.]|nr:hypothetical protein [Nitrospira sp.]
MAKKTLTTFKPTELLTWVVHDLGGAERRVDTEDVAVRAFEVAPNRFGWRKYPQHINLELVRVYLSDAKKQEHGRLLTGSGKSGWSLTQRGLDWLRSVELVLESGPVNPALSRPRRAGSVDTQRRDREARRLKTLAAWFRWVGHDQKVVDEELRAVFRIDSYSTPAALEAKVTRLRAMLTDDDELSAFLEHLSKHLARQENADG